LVRYPLMLEGGTNLRTWLRVPKTIPGGMIFVAGGKFICGNNEAAAAAGSGSEVSLDAFYIKKYEVTFREYLEFWRTLSGKERELYRGRRLAPDRTSVNLLEDDGGILPPYTEKLPVVGITREAAEAFCRWRSRMTGARYRLPTVPEWEKAARGPDGRSFVWGNHIIYDAALNGASDSALLARYPVGAPPGSFPADFSLYGVCDMEGNVREFTADSSKSGMLPLIKGASRFTGPDFLYCWRNSFEIMYLNDVGFRYVMEAEASERQMPVADGTALSDADLPVSDLLSKSLDMKSLLPLPAGGKTEEEWLGGPK
ncbi:MAG: SUMF1/EgtB/PvdO family nonheme iron enzyme, partial [Victivallales bacterium]|nr:SUMF1/EgtB/PvdO family nonheme iron enzyme [Victivallales bacterium]